MKLSFRSDREYSSAPAIGVIVLSTDETLEPELQHLMAGSGLRIYHSRIPFEPTVTPETLARMESALPASVALLPQHIKFNAIGFGCTSGATVIGAQRVTEIVQTCFNGVAVTDPISAVIAACHALSVKRLGLLTPYRPDVSASMCALLENNDLKISAFGSFEESVDYKVAGISESSTLAGILNIGVQECDAVFVSCTNLRTFGILEKAEAALGKPVISSNSAFAWHLQRLAGITNSKNR